MRPRRYGVNVSLAANTAHGGDAEGDSFTSIENLTGSAFDDTLEGDAGNNVLNGGNGVDTASYEHATAGVTVSLAITVAQNTVGAGSDTLTSIENLTGSLFDDVLSRAKRRNRRCGRVRVGVRDDHAGRGQRLDLGGARLRVRIGAGDGCHDERTALSPPRNAARWPAGSGWPP